MRNCASFSSVNGDLEELIALCEQADSAPPDQKAGARAAFLQAMERHRIRLGTNVSEAAFEGFVLSRMRAKNRADDLRTRRPHIPG